MIKTVMLTLVSVIAFAALIFGSWIYYEWSINKNDQIQRDRFNFQQSQQDKAVTLDADLAAIDVQIASKPENEAQLVAQRKAIATQLCGVISRINHPTPDVQTIKTKEC